MRTRDNNEFEVSPENWPVYELFERVHTQWRVGAFRIVGLDYNVVFGVLDRLGDYSGKEQLELLDKVKLIEIGFLNEINSKTK